MPRAVTLFPILGLRPSTKWTGPLPRPANDRYPLYTQLAISVARVIGERLRIYFSLKAD